MASATYTNISPNYANFQLVLKLSSTANVSANTSTVNYDCYIQVVAAASNYRYNNGNSCSISINGTSIVNTSNIGSIQCNNTPVGTRVVTLASGSMTVPHGSDGKKSIAFSASFRQTQSWELRPLSAVHSRWTTFREHQNRAYRVRLLISDRLLLLTRTERYRHSRIRYSIRSEAAPIRILLLV